MKKPSKYNYAFIDSQNLNLGIKSQGWTLDFRKFRLYLKNKYNVQTAYLFIGMMAGNESMYDKLQGMGYRLIFKPTTEYKVDGAVKVKGNVDAELVLYAAGKVFNEYEKAIIVSGDGDFHCLVEYLLEEEKLLKLLTPNKHYSGLLRKFNDQIVRIDLLKHSLELKKTKIRGRSKP
ncbi:NYN domain-containing protein [Candidatus Parcubacteria bacterium]|nr:NYN domain-containing protein [Candidatus Parcubacteria bacterium]